MLTVERSIADEFLGQVMAISNLIAKEFGGKKDLSGIGGVETGADAAEFLLLGSNSVQVCPPPFCFPFPWLKLKFPPYYQITAKSYEAQVSIINLA